MNEMERVAAIAKAVQVEERRQRQMRADLTEAVDLLRQVILGEDILTDRKWMQAATRLVGIRPASVYRHNPTEGLGDDEEPNR